MANIGLLVRVDVFYYLGNNHTLYFRISLNVAKDNTDIAGLFNATECVGIVDGCLIEIAIGKGSWRATQIAHTVAAFPQSNPFGINIVNCEFSSLGV